MIAGAGNISKGLAALLLASLFFSSDVRACSCMSSPTPWEARAEADFVFAGTVLETLQGDVRRKVMLQVQEAWKGESTERVTIQTSMSTASCGYPFVTGESYLVYAYARKGAYHTHLCTRTTTLREAQTDIEAFNELFLGANYPEPFRGETTITLGLPRRMEVSLDVFDSSGRLVKILIGRPLSAGTHRVEFDGGSLPSGVYFYRLQAEDYTSTRSMVLVR